VIFGRSGIVGARGLGGRRPIQPVRLPALLTGRRRLRVARRVTADIELERRGSCPRWVVGSAHNAAMESTFSSTKRELEAIFGRVPGPDRPSVEVSTEAGQAHWPSTGTSSMRIWTTSRPAWRTCDGIQTGCESRGCRCRRPSRPLACRERGSGGGTRTHNLRINSPPLCQLSYPGRVDHRCYPTRILLPSATPEPVASRFSATRGTSPSR
jgi:hypothetical protein